MKDFRKSRQDCLAEYKQELLMSLEVEGEV